MTSILLQIRVGRTPTVRLDVMNENDLLRGGGLTNRNTPTAVDKSSIGTRTVILESIYLLKKTSICNQSVGFLSI